MEKGKPVHFKNKIPNIYNLIKQCWNDLRKSIRIKIKKIKENREQPYEPISTEIQSKLTEHDWEIFKLDPASFGVDVDEDDSISFQSILVGDEIKTEFDETGTEVIELHDNDIQIIGPSTSSDGNFYVSSFDAEFEEPSNKVCVHHLSH